jgi:hypothetical protein
VAESIEKALAVTEGRADVKNYAVLAREPEEVPSAEAQGFRWRRAHARSETEMHKLCGSGPDDCSRRLIEVARSLNLANAGLGNPNGSRH